jgi:hypothetical protein
MSAILIGLLQPKVLGALQSFGTSEYSGPIDPGAAQQKMALEISQAVALAVQQYLTNNVLVIAGQGVTVATAGGPTNQVGGGVTVTPGKLLAP